MTTLNLLQRGRLGQSLSDLDIVDFHGHLGAYGFAVTDRSTQTMIDAMDRIGVRQVICSHMRCILGRPAIGNDEVLAAMRAHPGRILGYVALWPTSAKDVEDQTRRCLDAGFTGIKLHNSNGFGYTTAEYAPAWEIANRRRLPVLLHTWGDANMFKEVRQLAPKYPEAAIVLAHSSSMNEAEYIRVAQELPNVYLDLCHSKSPPGRLERLFRQGGSHKVLWGSDVYFINLTQQIGKILGAELTDDEKLMVLSGNARKVLGRILPG